MSKRISGGLVVNKRKSNVVSPKKTKGGSQYSSYLKFQKGGVNCPSHEGGNNPNEQRGDGSRKITIGRRRGGGKIKPCKNGSKKKKNEPGEIPILDVQFVKKDDKNKKEEVKREVKREVKGEVKGEVKREVKREVKGEVKREDKRRSSQKRVSRVNRVSRANRMSRANRANKVGGGNKASRNNKVRRVSRVSRANRVNRANKGYNKKEKKGRKVSVTTTRKLGKKETQKMQKKIKEIQNKSATDMINELKKEGIEVSGKSKTILKDIYMYQKMCGINIKRE